MRCRSSESTLVWAWGFPGIVLPPHLWGPNTCPFLRPPDGRNDALFRAASVSGTNGRVAGTAWHSILGTERWAQTNFKNRRGGAPGSQALLWTPDSVHNAMGSGVPRRGQGALSHARKQIYAARPVFPGGQTAPNGNSENPARTFGNLFRFARGGRAWHNSWEKKPRLQASSGFLGDSCGASQPSTPTSNKT